MRKLFQVGMSAMGLRALIAWTVMIVWLGAAPAWAAKRVALVIGNSAYRAMPGLKNPGRDATDIANALTRLGFEATTVLNADARSMNAALKRFSQNAAGAEIVFVFYSGHGAQFEGRNWLLPVDAKLETREDINDADLMALDRITSTLRDKSAVRIVVLDACRDNPVVNVLHRRIAEAAGYRSAMPTKGLARSVTAAGDLLVYATQEGAVAADGTGSHSPFTESLLKHLETENLDVRQMFFRVQEDVARRHKQLPEVANSIIGEYKLKLVALPPEPPKVDPAAEAWAIVKDTTSIAILEEFRRRYPNGVFAGFATARIEELKKTLAAISKPEPPKVDPAAQAWTAVKDSNSVAVLEEFRKRYPDSVYAGFASARVEELKKAEAARAPKPEAPKVDPAMAAWATVKDTNSIAVLEEFRRQYGASSYAAFATARIEELKKAQAEAAAKAAAAAAKAAEPKVDPAERAWASVKESSSIAILEEFHKRYPGTVYAGFAAVRIGELKKQQAATAPADAGKSKLLAVAPPAAAPAAPVKIVPERPKVEPPKPAKVEPKPKTPAPKPAEAAARKPAGGGGGNCFNFNGKRFCE